MIDLVTDAYDKLKSYVYYDNFSLDLRVKLAEYEKLISSNIERLSSELETYINSGTSEYIDVLINNIKYRIIPKKFKKNEINDADGIFYISNINEKEEYVCEKETYFIDCHVDLHIISFLWVLKIGNEIDKDLGSQCYAYRTVKRTGKKKIWIKKVFPRYFEKYQYWRDNALRAAKALHSVGEDVAIISLDIKNYYDSVNMDLSQLDLPENGFKFLNDLLIKVHDGYKNKRAGTSNVTNKLLPIGLVSSGMLANFYLKSLDEKIEEKIKPKFYGRYVDDLLLVISNPELTDDPAEFIENKLVKKEVLTGEGDEYSVTIGDHKIYIQKEKFKIYHFKATEPITLLDEFRRTIKKNSSEFKFLPEVDNLFRDFTSKSLNISYSDTINKIRSIEGINHDKYGSSKHLANILFVLKETNNLKDDLIETINGQIGEIFRGQRNLELNGLWEKVFTIFTINKDTKQIVDFLEYTVNLILKIKHKEYFTLQEALTNHLINSLSMAVALDFPFFSEYIFREIKERMIKLPDDVSFVPIIEARDVREQAQHLISSNLFRHNYIQFPLLNICKQSDDFSFRDAILNKVVNFRFHHEKSKFFPRFIQYHELGAFYLLESLCKKNAKLKNHNFIIKKYIDINKLNPDKKLLSFPTEKNIFHNARLIDTTITSSKKSKYKISIINIQVDADNSKSNYLNRPNLSDVRMSEINHVLNLSVKEGADIIVFPEISIPFQWLSHISDFSKRNGVAIICGVEHISNKDKEVFNYSATILPFSFDGFNNVLMDLRLKIDYSPEEIRQIEGRAHKIPKKIESEKLRLYKWGNCIFTVFNCFELADIKKRSIFKGNVDFVVAIEHNRDTDYFSNITESVSRDIHAYVIQVNSSHFGDSRITQPAKSYKKDIVRIKGGINTTIITGIIDVTELRKFQNKNFDLQKDHEYLKPTPPQFKLSKDRKVY